MAAGATPTACVARANRLQFYADSRSLIGDLESHIGIWPAVDFGTEVFPLTQRTVSDIAEFFYNDAPCSNLNRVADQCLTCRVEQVRGYGSLMPGHPSQEPPGTSGANRLDSGAGAPDARTTVIQHPAVEEKWFGVHRVRGDQHPFDAEIAANDTTFGLRIGNLNFMREAQIPRLADTFDLGIFPCAFWQLTRIADSQEFTPKCDAFIGAVEVPLPHRRDDGTGKLRKPPTLVRLGGLVGSADGFAEGAGKLGRQSHFSEIGIVGFCQPIRVQFLSFEGNRRKPVCGFQPNSKQAVSFCAAGNLELDCADCFHYIEDYYQEKTMSTELRRNNHSVSRLLVHLVFVVKYRHAVISDSVWTSLRYGFDLSAKRLDLVLVELNHDKDHAHLVVEYPPKVSISEMANALKGNSSFVARRDCKEELRKKLWGSVFWSPSFFAASCGGAPIETLKLYVQSQQTKAALKGGVSTHKF
jgi:putative transposase